MSKILTWLIGLFPGGGKTAVTAISGVVINAIQAKWPGFFTPEVLSATNTILGFLGLWFLRLGVGKTPVPPA